MINAQQAFRAQLVVPMQQELFDYWISCCTENALPGRCDFSPAAVPTLLPYISLIDVADAEKFRVRLAGTHLRDVFDREITGQFVHELERLSTPGYWQRACQSVVETAQPAQGAIKSPRITKDHLVQFWMRLPFADEDGQVTQLLGFDICIPSMDIKFDISDCDHGEHDLMVG